jgi:hypothetical protein
MGEGSERAIGVTYDVLARAAEGEPRIGEPLAAALQALRDVDNRGFLAYALLVAAGLDLRAGRIELARTRAEEALGAAEVVNAANETARARLMLSRIAEAGAELEPARKHLAYARALVDTGRLGSRMREAIETRSNELAQR